MPRNGSYKPDQLRMMIAQEAARLIQEQGLTDFRNAKVKAKERLGLKNRVPLPGNDEVEQALAERTRIFNGADHPLLLRRLRSVAIEVMGELKQFYPRLVGPVLSGHATEHSPIDLHLFSDTVEAVGASLDALGTQHKLVQRRMRMRREQVDRFPGFRFFREGVEIAATVFPERSRGQAPLSPVNGRPMQRAGIRTVRDLTG